MIDEKVLLQSRPEAFCVYREQIEFVRENE